MPTVKQFSSKQNKLYEITFHSNGSEHKAALDSRVVPCTGDVTADHQTTRGGILLKLTAANNLAGIQHV